MKPTKLWEISVTVAPEAEDAAAVLLERLFNLVPSAYTDRELGLSRVSVFTSQREDWNPAMERLLAAGLRRLRECGLATGPAEISCKELRAVDWAEAWKQHFKPITIGSALLVKPSWSKRRPRRGQAVVVLDPGLSFGTGQHPTTLFCLRQLVRRRRRHVAQSFLDIGTGSGDSRHRGHEARLLAGASI